MDIQGMNVAKILQCVDPEEAVIERPPGLPSLPLADETAFNEFEHFLQVPTNSTATVSSRVNWCGTYKKFGYYRCGNHKTIVSLLQSLYLSGKLLDQTVPYKGAQKLLRAMISNSLSRVISWEGTHGLKIAFNKSKCADVLLSAILRRFSDKHMGLVKQKIQKWFDCSQGRKVASTRSTSNAADDEPT